MKLFHIVTDSESERAERARYEVRSLEKGGNKRQYDKKIEIVTDPADADYILVAGGDGTMLRAIHECHQFQKPFFGLNCGTVGFLMNPPHRKDDDFEDFAGAAYEAFNEPENNLQIISLRLLDVMTSGPGNGERIIKRFVAFNDVYFNAPPGHVCRMKVSGKNYREKDVVGDGVIIATPQGSSAYNRNAGGSILPLGHDIMAITSICSAIEPIRDVVKSQKITVKLDPLRGIVVHADNIRVDNADWVEISPSEISVKIAFRSGYDFEAIRYQFNQKFARR